MLRDLIRLVQTWATCDRVRTRPSDGRLLDLRPADEVFILGEWYEVIDRFVEHSIEYPAKHSDQRDSENQPRIHYRLQELNIAETGQHHWEEPSDKFNLIVLVESQTAMLIRVGEDLNEAVEVFPDQVVVNASTKG